MKEARVAILRPFIAVQSEHRKRWVVVMRVQAAAPGHALELKYSAHTASAAAMGQPAWAFGR